MLQCHNSPLGRTCLCIHLAESQNCFHFEAKDFYLKVLHKNLYVAIPWFHLCDLSRVGKFLDTRSKLLVDKAGDGVMGSSCQWGEVSFGDENDLELGYGIVA